MTLANFSFSNQLIADYFRGSNTYIPVSELLYVHSHPLVKPNFVSELEGLINLTIDLIEAKNIKGVQVERITNLTLRLGQSLPNVTKENAPQVLEILRGIHKVCTGLLKNHKFADDSVPGMKL